jgi:hypothetical protein
VVATQGQAVAAKGNDVGCRVASTVRLAFSEIRTFPLTFTSDMVQDVPRGTTTLPSMTQLASAARAIEALPKSAAAAIATTSATVLTPGTIGRSGEGRPRLGRRPPIECRGELYEGVASRVSDSQGTRLSNSLPRLVNEATHDCGIKLKTHWVQIQLLTPRDISTEMLSLRIWVAIGALSRNHEAN